MAAKKQETELLQEEKNIRDHILNAAGEGIYGIDMEGRATFINKAAIDMLGWRPEDVVGTSIHEAHHHSYSDGSPYPREDCPIYAAIRDGAIHRVDNEVFWHKDGSVVPVEYTSTPIIRNSKLEGAVVVFRDVSQRRKLEQERDSAFREIEKLNHQLEQEKAYLLEEADLAANYGEIIGESEKLKYTLTQIEAVAPTPVNVLVHGESGVGKEMIARAIHARSIRAAKPLVRVNCASIPEHLFESEFFGHVKGAFTGAHRDRIGRMQLADGGTLFLDEVGEIPLTLQSKILRGIQEGEFERVGEDETRKVDVRIVAATNRDLQKEIGDGTFRKDLFYRLSVFPIEVAPLRLRREDIVPLAMNFISRICKDLGRETLALSKKDAAQLENQDWPGNIRELKNFVERAVILSTGTKLNVEFQNRKRINDTQELGLSQSSESFLTEGEFQDLEKANIKAALKCANGKVSGEGGAAELMQIKPSTLSYRIKKLGISI